MVINIVVTWEQTFAEGCLCPNMYMPVLLAPLQVGTHRGETEAVAQSQGSASAHPRSPSLLQGFPGPLGKDSVCWGWWVGGEQQSWVGLWEDPRVLGGRERGTRRSHPCGVTQNLPAVWALRPCPRKESDRRRGPGATPCPESVSSEDQLLPAGSARWSVSLGCSRRKERGMHRLWGCQGSPARSC